MVDDDESVTDGQAAPSVPFPTGSLWQRLIGVSGRALESGHLLPIPTHQQTLVDGDAVFQTHVVENLKRKQLVSRTAGGNPFLPFEPEMYVSDVAPHHVALLNKFKVVDHHLLIVTREFEPQEARLNRADFLALWRCLSEYRSLGFYNSGIEAGASQPHKHMQVIPLSNESSISLEPLYDLASTVSLRIGMSARLPFAHRLVRFVEDEMREVSYAANVSHDLYDGFLEQLGWRDVGSHTPYNLLVTPQWMLFVPRRRECFRSISLNAMAFAGSLLVKDERQLETLREQGPMRALVEVSGRRDE